jgi:hypothetical protein
LLLVSNHFRIEPGSVLSRLTFHLGVGQAF